MSYTTDIKLTEEQWEAARKDAVILEEKISELVEEFEQKHKPIQANVLTRWRDWQDKYSMSKGGAAQIKLHKALGEDIGKMITITSHSFVDPIDKIVYTED